MKKILLRIFGHKRDDTKPLFRDFKSKEKKKIITKAVREANAEQRALEDRYDILFPQGSIHSRRKIHG